VVVAIFGWLRARAREGCAGWCFFLESYWCWVLVVAKENSVGILLIGELLARLRVCLRFACGLLCDAEGI
jgi:hypothetical protein